MHGLTSVFRDAWSAHRSPIFAQKVGLLPRRPAALYGMKTMAAWTEIEKQRLRKLHADGLTPVRMLDHFPGRSRSSIIGQTCGGGSSTQQRSLKSSKSKKAPSPIPLQTSVKDAGGRHDAKVH